MESKVPNVTIIGAGGSWKTGSLLSNGVLESPI